VSERLPVWWSCIGRVVAINLCVEHSYRLRRFGVVNIISKLIEILDGIATGLVAGYLHCFSILLSFDC
jgi:hypothetical protein